MKKRKIHRIFFFFKHANLLNTLVIIIRRFRFDSIVIFLSVINKRIFIIIYSNFSKILKREVQKLMNLSFCSGKKSVAVY